MSMSAHRLARGSQLAAALVLFLMAFASPARATTEVVFAPTPGQDTHIARIVEAFDGASRSIDIAIYGLDDQQIVQALAAAVSRGVGVRMLYEQARDPDSPGAPSSSLETIGVDVRSVNKILHHKFAIIDGVHAEGLELGEGLLITGSANWHERAARSYDENTLFTNHPELLLRFQREFDTLWRNSRPFPEDVRQRPTRTRTARVRREENDPLVGAWFTSANFEVYQSDVHGPTFRIADRDRVASKLVEAIHGATESIDIAANHLRSRTVTEAILARHAEAPSVRIRVLLDGQEYISDEGAEAQRQRLVECLAKAGSSESAERRCRETGSRFGYAMHQAGVPVRFVHYAYRWDLSYASIMHDKFMIIDGRQILTGSYNLSDNSEHDSFENVVFFDADADGFGGIVGQYVDRFESMWERNRASGLYDDLLALLEGDAATVPIVYPPMALDQGQVTALRQAVRASCPDLDDPAFRTAPDRHLLCGRNAETRRDEQGRAEGVFHDTPDGHRAVRFERNERGRITALAPVNGDQPAAAYELDWSEDGGLRSVRDPAGRTWHFEVDDDQALSGLWGDADHRLGMSFGGDETLLIEPELDGHRWVTRRVVDPTTGSEIWHLPNGTELSRRRDSRGRLLAVDFPEDSLDFAREGGAIMAASNRSGESMVFFEKAPRQYEERISGLVEETLSFSVSLESRSVLCQLGEAELTYRYADRGRLVQAGPVSLESQALTERLERSRMGQLEERWEYNAFDDPVFREVSFAGEAIYETRWGYDGLGRIELLVERLPPAAPVTSTYGYDNGGRLVQVVRDGQVVESYGYDERGNLVSDGAHPGETFSYDAHDRLVQRGATSYRYDGLGRLSEKNVEGVPALTTRYDTLGRLREAATPDGAIEYRLDGFARRIGKAVDGELTYKLVRLPGGRLFAQLNPEGSPTSLFVYGSQHETPIAIVQGERSLFVVSDLLASPRLVIDAETGRIVQSLAFDAYGRVREDTAPGFQPFGFTGGLYDPDTGLVRLGWRDYASADLRWTAKDPLFLLGGDTNLYAYTRGDPVNLRDPTGSWSWGSPGTRPINEMLESIGNYEMLMAAIRDYGMSDDAPDPEELGLHSGVDPRVQDALEQVEACYATLVESGEDFDSALDDWDASTENNHYASAMSAYHAAGRRMERIRAAYADAVTDFLDSFEAYVEYYEDSR